MSLGVPGNPERSPMVAADTLLTGFSVVVIIALIVGLIYWRTRKH